MRPPLRALGRTLPVFAVALAIALLLPSTVHGNGAHNSGAGAGPWPRLPTDAEIQAAADAKVAELAGYGWSMSIQTYKVTGVGSGGVEQPTADNMDVMAIGDIECSDKAPGQTCRTLTTYILDYGDGGWLFRETNNSGTTEMSVESWTQSELDPKYWIPGWTASADPDATDDPSTAPTAEPELPFCAAVISVPPNLKAGDTLSPDAEVTSTDGAPVTGSISTVWIINGVTGSSVTWDGTPATIVLQLSCQGHAQEFRATYNGTLVQESSAPAPSSAPEPSGSTGPGETSGPNESAVPQPGNGDNEPGGGGHRGSVPGLGGVGSVPGPTDPLSGLVGTLGAGILGVLGGLLISGAGGGTPPVSPSGPGGGGGPGGGPGGGGPGGGPGGGGPGGSGEGPTPAEPTEPPAPYESGDPATRVAITKLAGAMNRAAAMKNAAMIDAISAAQADAFDADGKVIPEKMAAAWQIIRGATGGGPGQLPEDAEIPWAVTDATKAGLGAIPTAVGMAGGAVVTIAKGAGDLAVNAVKGFGQIGDAIWNYKLFGKGLDAEMKGFVKGAAGAEVNEANTALKDGRYLDALGAQGRGTAKVIGAVGSKAWSVARDILPADEIETFNDPNASLEQKLWAVPSAAAKTAALLLGGEAGVKPVPGIRPSATLIPSAVPGARAAEAAAAAGREAAAATGAAREAAETMQASAAAAARVERLTADTLGGKAAPASLREGAQILAKNPELRAAVDRAILEDAGSGSIRALRQDGTLGPDAHNIITARRVEQQGQAMSNAGERIAREDAAGWIQANTDPATGLVDYAAAPRRLFTSEATEGNRGFISGAHAGTDLDRTFYTQYVSTARANEILAEECGNLGFTKDSLATNAYTARPGTLMDTSSSAAAPNNDAWLRRNMGQINSQSGYVPTHISSDGAVTTTAHVGGSRGAEALPMGERFGAPRELPWCSTEAASSVTHQIEGLAGAGNNISDGVKFTARAIKDGAHFDGSADAIMRAASIKDPAAQAAILRDAGINSVADLQARLRP